MKDLNKSEWLCNRKRWIPPVGTLVYHDLDNGQGHPRYVIMEVVPNSMFKDVFPHMDLRILLVVKGAQAYVGTVSEICRFFKWGYVWGRDLCIVENQVGTGNVSPEAQITSMTAQRVSKYKGHMGAMDRQGNVHEYDGAAVFGCRVETALASLVTLEKASMLRNVGGNGNGARRPNYTGNRVVKCFGSYEGPIEPCVNCHASEKCKAATAAKNAVPEGASGKQEVVMDSVPPTMLAPPVPTSIVERMVEDYGVAVVENQAKVLAFIPIADEHGAKKAEPEMEALKVAAEKLGLSYLTLMRMLGREYSLVNVKRRASISYTIEP